MKTNERRYRITYDVKHHPEGVTKSELNGRGATDAIFVASLLRDPSGASSTALLAIDGETGEKLSVDEQFKMWTLMAKNLADELPAGGRRDLCTEVFEAVRKSILRGRGIEE